MKKIKAHTVKKNTDKSFSNQLESVLEQLESVLEQLESVLDRLKFLKKILKKS